MNFKGKTTKRLISLLMAVAMIACIICAAVVPMSAASDDVRSVADGVLYFGVSYGNTFSGGRGSCFLINEDTIITANHCTQLTKQIYDLAKQYNISKEELDANFKYTVTLARDFTISATLVNNSENMDFAILKLSQPINNRTFLTLRDSKTVMPAETVYGVGFPASKDALDSTAQYYNQKDMVFESGKINKAQYTDSFNFTDALTGTAFNFSGDVLMYSGGTTSGGNSGGPVVDEDGNVIGIVSCGNDSSCYASAISQVMEILDALGIKYTKADEPVPEPETAEIETSEPVEETVAPTVAETVAPPEPPQSNGWIIYLIIGLAVVLIAVVVVIIVIVTKKGNGNGPKPGAPASGPQAPNKPRPAAPQAPQAPPYAQPYNRPQMPTGSAPTVPSNEGAGETSVLNDGAGETTVLGGGQATGFSLMRKSNNESISINKPEFTIGKERRRVDYCIANNNSVSRVHAKLRVRGGVCYISDLGSTNCTYVNGTKLSPNQEVALKKGDKIKISDEEFEMI